MGNIWSSPPPIVERFAQPGTVSFYEHQDFLGQSYTATAPAQVGYVQWIGFPNDAIDSVQVGPDTIVTFYQHAHFGGASLRLGTGDYNLRNYGWGDQISSFTVESIALARQPENNYKEQAMAYRNSAFDVALQASYDARSAVVFAKVVIDTMAPITDQKLKNTLLEYERLTLQHRKVMSDLDAVHTTLSYMNGLVQVGMNNLTVHQQTAQLIINEFNSIITSMDTQKSLVLDTETQCNTWLTSATGVVNKLQQIMENAFNETTTSYSKYEEADDLIALQEVPTASSNISNALNDSKLILSTLSTNNSSVHSNVQEIIDSAKGMNNALINVIVRGASDIVANQNNEISRLAELVGPAEKAYNLAVATADDVRDPARIILDMDTVNFLINNASIAKDNAYASASYAWYSDSWANWNINTPILLNGSGQVNAGTYLNAATAHRQNVASAYKNITDKVYNSRTSVRSAALNNEIATRNAWEAAKLNLEEAKLKLGRIQSTATTYQATVLPFLRTLDQTLTVTVP